MSPRITSIYFVALALVSGPAFAQTSLYQNYEAPLEARLDDLFGKLIQDEKIALLTGTGFSTASLPRLGVPGMEMVDAGQGVRGGSEGTKGPATAFPSGVAMASTWDTELIGRIGKALGEETLNKGTGAQILLGPAVNIHRSPLGGRNGEYFSEDPFLSARLGVNYIQGLQSTGAIACVKHFAANNQEFRRHTIDARVSERALREIYLPSFEAAVKEAHVGALMSSYNMVNGYKASANSYLLTEVLKKGWGFDGVVMSDWHGVKDTVGPLNAGNDLEMPGKEFMTPPKVNAALQSGQAQQAGIDDSVRRILRTILRAGLLNGPRKTNPAIVDSPAHRQLCLEAASKGIVLLKNQKSILPLDAQKLRSIAVIGSAATAPQIGAGGSPLVTPVSQVTPLQGIQKRVGSAVKLNVATGTLQRTPLPENVLHPANEPQATGMRAEYFANTKLEGTPALVRTDKQIQFKWSGGAPGTGLARTYFSVRWTGTLVAPSTGRYQLSLSGDDGYRLFLDDNALINRWADGVLSSDVTSVNLVAGRSYKLRVEYFQGKGDAEVHLNWLFLGKDAYADAVEAARKSDVALVFVSTMGTERESVDRPSMKLPEEQDDLIRAVVAANPKTIVVLNNGTPILMNGWLDQVPALLETWFPGEEGGSALAGILFGDINPSGKLPDTLAVRREDYPDFGNFPGDTSVNYSEGIYVGYCHFDKAKIAPLFPFGYGLSYTTFRYSRPRLSQPSLASNGSVTVTVDITNTGRRAGSEIVQLYVHDPRPQIDKAVRELKGFGRVELAPNQTKTLKFTLQPRAFAYCDVPGKQWKADAGSYELQIGASSRDIRLKLPLQLTSTYTEAIAGLEEQNRPAKP